MPVIEKDVEMIWDEEAQQQFDAATECYICNKALDRDAETPARDHCHFTGNQFKFLLYQWYNCSNCKLKVSYL